MTDRPNLSLPSKLLRAGSAAAMILLFGVIGLYFAGGQVVDHWESNYYLCISNRQQVGLGLFAAHDVWGNLDVFPSEARWESTDHAGFACDLTTFTTSASGFFFRFIIAWWLALSLPLPLALVRVIAYLRRTKPITDGRVPCPACEYDLRASADRCPECGRAITLPVVTPVVTPTSRRWIVWPWLAILIAAYAAAWLAHRARPGFDIPYGPEWAWHNGLADVAILTGFVLTGIIAVRLTRIGRPAVAWPQRLLIAASVFLPWFTLFVQ